MVEINISSRDSSIGLETEGFCPIVAVLNKWFR